MTGQNLYRQLALFSVGLSVNLVSNTVLPTQAQVTSEVSFSSRTPASRANIQLNFEPPDKGQPDDTVGAGSRDGGQCPQDASHDPPITSLTPANRYGLTVAERPRFFVYVPQTSARKALISLKDEKEDYYYQTTLPLPETPGIVSFKLPDDAPPLEIGKRYQWYFVTICSERLAVDDPRVEAQIQRVEINPADLSRLENLPPLERAALYSAQGIWYDTVASLAELRRSQPKDSTLAATWEDLLKSVGLGAISTKSPAQ